MLQVYDMNNSTIMGNMIVHYLHQLGDGAGEGVVLQTQYYK